MDGSSVSGSESKKRGCEELEELSQIGEKRAKIRDLQSVFRSEGKMKIDIASTLDLNAKSSHFPCDDAPSCVDDSKTNYVKKSKGFGLDLNSEDVSSSISHDIFHPYKNYERVKARDALSECGSTCGPGGERDSMRVWKEMKQNGFLSSSHGGVLVPPMPMPKPRGRKKANESVIKKKIEIAKKEQVDRFAKVAAPSGLLNELNPGIINHVRNRKQVHSIIENLVRSARTENNNGGSKQAYDKKALENGTSDPSYSNLECEDDILTLKLSSSATMASLNTSSVSNEESANGSTVNSLSIKAASVALQWLELLHQDIKGRLAALRRSKKRVRAVIQTELPFLVSRELVSNQECDHGVRSPENGLFDKGISDLHRARWSALFSQMDNALSEEEKHLESSLNQVNEMLLHCEHGLLQFHPANSLPQHASDYRLPKSEISLDKDLAVRAAAAAIYSTSNFLQSMENLPCF